MIALEVVRTSFGFHLREYMGSCPPPPELYNRDFTVVGNGANKSERRE